MRASTRVTQICAAATVALLIGACGSSSSGANGGSTGSTSAQAPTSGSSSATVTLTTVPGYGKVLATTSGKALYMLTADQPKSSACNSACASTWPPLTASGKPSAGSGVNASMLSAFKRSDGKQQVSYDGHALYTYAGPTATSGEGMASDGGAWYFVDASGKPVKHTSHHGY